MELTARIKKGDNRYIASCPELDVISQGHTIEEALKNLKEAVDLYVNEVEFSNDIKTEEVFVTQFHIKEIKGNKKISVEKEKIEILYELTLKLWEGEGRRTNNIDEKLKNTVNFVSIVLAVFVAYGLTLLKDIKFEWSCCYLCIFGIFLYKSIVSFWILL